ASPTRLKPSSMSTSCAMPCRNSGWSSMINTVWAAVIVTYSRVGRLPIRRAMGREVHGDPCPAAFVASQYKIATKMVRALLHDHEPVVAFVRAHGGEPGPIVAHDNAHAAVRVIEQAHRRVLRVRMAHD